MRIVADTMFSSVALLLRLHQRIIFQFQKRSTRRGVIFQISFFLIFKVFTRNAVFWINVKITTIRIRNVFVMDKKTPFSWFWKKKLLVIVKLSTPSFKTYTWTLDIFARYCCFADIWHGGSVWDHFRVFIGGTIDTPTAPSRPTSFRGIPPSFVLVFYGATPNRFGRAMASNFIGCTVLHVDL